MVYSHTVAGVQVHDIGLIPRNIVESGVVGINICCIGKRHGKKGETPNAAPHSRHYTSRPDHRLVLVLFISFRGQLYTYLLILSRLQSCRRFSPWAKALVMATSLHFNTAWPMIAGSHLHTCQDHLICPRHIEPVILSRRATVTLKLPPETDRGFWLQEC
jgi:hypothetical protein